MLVTHLSLLPIVFLALEGCAGPTAPVNQLYALSPEERRSVVQLPIYEEGELSGKEYAVVNMVEGTSCTNKRGDSGVTEVKAIIQAKHVAHVKGAEGIKNLQCDPSRPMTTSDCVETIICKGQAIKFGR